MTTTENSNQKTIVTYAVLAGLTPLIPIPFVDDLAKAYFKRRMVRLIAKSRNQVFDSEQIKTLADDKDRGCLLGCLTAVTVYPLKKIFRKIFFFLEWKRAIDTVSHTYYQGYLIDHALNQMWLAPYGPAPAGKIRSGIDTVLDQTNTSLIERAVVETFRQSKSALKNAAGLMKRALGGLPRRAPEDQVERAIESIERQEEREVEGAVSQLMNSINRLPSDHFERIKAMLDTELNRQ
jgi:hypothetical protein